MKSKLGAAVALVATLGALGFTHTPSADAKPKDPVVAADPPMTRTAISPTITTISFGMSPKALGDAVDRILDADYAPLYKGVQPGVKMKELDDALAEDKDAFRRTRVDFGKLPTGYDAGPLRGEFTYNNKEAVYNLTRKGETTYYFFIQERLWKIIEEKKLSDASPLGKTYADAVVKMSANFGVPGRLLQPDGTRSAVEVDWKDANTHLRAIQRSDTWLGLAYEDNGTLANLASLRPNKPPADNGGIDPDVAASLRGPDKDPTPKTNPKKK